MREITTHLDGTNPGPRVVAQIDVGVCHNYLYGIPQVARHRPPQQLGKPATVVQEVVTTSLDNHIRFQCDDPLVGGWNGITELTLLAILRDRCETLVDKDTSVDYGGALKAIKEAMGALTKPKAKKTKL